MTNHCGRIAMTVVLVIAGGMDRYAAAQTIKIVSSRVVAQEVDPRRFSEPHLAVDPANPQHMLAAVWASTTDGPDEHLRCASFVSLNSGESWIRHDFKIANCYDAQVAVLPDGQAVFSALGTLQGLRPDRLDWLIVLHSDDGGMTWDERPTTLGYRFDHPAIAADTQSPDRKGWIYLTSHLEWGDGTADRKSAVVVTRSRDGGKTFDVPTFVSPNGLHNIAEMPAVLPDGMLVVAFVDDAWKSARAPRRAWTIRSSDGGVTFSSPVLVTDVCGPPPNFQLSALAVDSSTGPYSGQAYFACRTGSGGPVVVFASPDGGQTWHSAAVPVGSRDIDRDVRRVMTMTVNNQGVVGVMIVERRAAAAECLSVQFMASFDGAATFSAPETVSRSVCRDSSSERMVMRRFPTYGDYFGLAAVPGGGFRLMWAEMRDGMSTLVTSTLAVQKH